MMWVILSINSNVGCILKGLKEQLQQQAVSGSPVISKPTCLCILPTRFRKNNRHFHISSETAFYLFNFIIMIFIITWGHFFLAFREREKYWCKKEALICWHPDQESNPQPFRYRMTLQLTEPQQRGPKWNYFLVYPSFSRMLWSERTGP